MLYKLLLSTTLVVAISAGALQLQDPATCKLCKAGVTELKVVWGDQDTQDLLKLGQTFICANVPIEDCDNWITTQLGKLGDLITGLDPAAACTQAALCSYGVQGDSFGCDFCEFIGEEVKKRVLINATIDEVIVVVEEICDKLPIAFLSNECHALVAEYGQYYLDLLVGNLDVEELCGKMGLCSEDVRHMVEATELYQVVMAGLRSDDECKACTDGMDILKTILSSDDTKDLLHIVVKDFCAEFSISDCEAIGDTLVDQVLAYFLPMLDPAKVCQEMGACPAPEPLFLSVGDDSPACQACQDGLGELKKASKDPATVEIVNDLGDYICSKLEIPFCKNIIDKLLQENLVKVQNLDVDATCISLGACTAATDVTTTQNVGDICSECTMIAGEIITLLDNDSIDDLIKEAIGEICSVLPISNCESTLDGYFDQIIAFIKNLDAKTLCSLIGMCSSGPTPILKQTPVVVPEVGDVCSECTAIAGEIITLLDNDSIDDLIKEAIGEICTVLPISNCESTLDGYFDEILALVKNLDAKTLCSLIGLCGSEPNPILKQTPVVVPEVGDACSECTAIAGEIITLLDNDSMDNLIKEAIGEICSVLPISNCESTLDGYFDEILALVKNLDAKTLCSLIGLCGSEPAPLAVLPKLGDVCSECSMIAELALKELKDPAIQQQIEAALDEVCAVLPIPNCKDTIHTYLAQIEAFLDGTDGKSLCQLIGLCTSCQKQTPVVVPEVGDVCSECTMIAGEIITLLDNDSIDDLIKEAIGEICSVLPISNCESTLDGYFDEIIAFIKNLDAKTLCSLIGLCGSDLTLLQTIFI